MKSSRSFASDNNSGIHPEILSAIQAANSGHVPAYGSDPYTERAGEVFKRVFGADSESFFVFNGTAANVLCLQTLMRSYHAVICARTAHIHVDECGAPEKMTQGKLLAIEPTPEGKLTPELIKPALVGFGDQHHIQPKVISISQATEYGTVYSQQEIRELAELAHANGLYLHMDGARISNAAASLGKGLREITRDCGVDALSFGGTKNGLLAGEAVVLFDSRLAEGFKFLRKQSMQLCSKMRFIAAQFEALLDGDLWLRNATHSNRMARLLESEVSRISRIKITRPVQANAVFARVPKKAIPTLQAQVFFHVWDASNHPDNRNSSQEVGQEVSQEVRWMTSFDTTEEDVRAFVALLRETLP